MRTYILVTAALLMLSPLALAQEEKTENSTRPDDAAWVEDCPPDMMCAATTEEPSRGPEDGSCEYCRGNETPVHYGADDCIDCSGPAPDAPTCMDGADAGEACDEDVQYIGGAPTSGTPISSHADATEEEPKTVPALALAGLLFVAAIAVVLRRST